MDDQEWRKYVDNNGDFCPDGVCDVCGVGNQQDRTYGLCKKCHKNDVLGIHAEMEFEFWDRIEKEIPEYDEYNDDY